MLIAVALLAQPAPAATPPCRAAQLRLTLDGRDGDFNGMQHLGIELSLRNTGPDCTLHALPTITFLDARGRPLPATRRPPPGMHPGPVMLPVVVPAGHRAATDLRWISGPVFPRNRELRAAAVSVRIGGANLSAPLSVVLDAPAGAPADFDQSPLRAMEGLAAG